MVPRSGRSIDRQESTWRRGNGDLSQGLPQEYVFVYCRSTRVAHCNTESHASPANRVALFTHCCGLLEQGILSRYYNNRSRHVTHHLYQPWQQRGRRHCRSPVLRHRVSPARSYCPRLRFLHRLAQVIVSDHRPLAGAFPQGNLHCCCTAGYTG